MFYSAQILSKKGPLGSVWIASWSQRGLKRNEVFSCSLPAAVDSIINPEAPLALRLSGQLLLGLVRLYLRKLQFLEEDAGLALRGLNRNAAAAGGGQAVDLPDGGVAPEMAITLQDGSYDPMAQFVGNELFPSFESSLFPDAGGNLASAGGGGLGGAFQPGGYGGGGGASVTVAQDISELFGSHWTAPEDERFEVDGDAMDRRFSTELERLRSQGVEAPRNRADMFFGGGQDDTFSPVMDDEVMAVPPDDLFAGPGPTPGRTPLSAAAGRAPLPGMSDMRITPPTLPGGGAADLLPDIGGGSRGGAATATTSAGTFGGGFSMGGDDVEPMSVDFGAAEAAAAGAAAEGPEVAAAAAAGEPGGAAAAAAARRRQPGLRRRRPVVDAHSDGRAATTLPSDLIRHLLMDRKPLIQRRGLRARRQPAQLPPRHFDVVAQSEDARDSELYRPNAYASLAPELLELYGRTMTLPGQAQQGGPAAQRRRRSSRGTVGEADEAAAAVAEEAAEEQRQAGAAPSAGAAAEEAEPGSPAAAAAGAQPAMSGGFTGGGGGGSMFSGGAASDFGPMSAGGGGGYEDDYVEHPDTQWQQANAAATAAEDAAAAALFPAGPEEEEEEEGGREGAGTLAAATAAERRGRLPLQPVSGNGQLPAELGSIGADSGSEGASQQTSFTRNTALVLEHLRREFAPATGSKRRHPSQGDLAAGMAALSLDGMLLQAGGGGGGAAAPRGRLDAARWFYESLVLCNTGFISLQQQEPYGDISILPTARFAAASGGSPPSAAP